MKRTFLGLLTLICIAANPITADAVSIYGLTTGNLLLRFDSATPGTISQVLIVSGLQVGDVLQAIDFRPATCELMGLGNSNRLYAINTNTGAATAVGSPSAFTLSGSAFGFDFNPVVDRIRVVSDTNQNLRLNPIDGTLVNADGVLNPGDPNVVGSAYVNNYPGTTLTTLYGIDSGTDSLVIQNPPNNGTLVNVGPLNFNAGPVCGFDISVWNEAFAAMASPGDTISKLFQINLSTGNATSIGNIGGGLILGLAIVPAQLVRFTSSQFSANESSGKATISLTRLNDATGTTTVNYGSTPGTATASADYQPVSGSVSFGPGETIKTFDVPLVNDSIPELNETVLLSISSTDTNVVLAGLTNATLEIVSTQDLPTYLLTVSNQLLRFSTSPIAIQTNIQITGLQTGEAVLAIDFRPATGQLFGLGSSNRLYTINPTSGIAAAIGSPGAFTLSGTNFGFDFNPVADRIRVVSDANQNLRLNPIDGTLTATDTALNPGNPSLVASAYLNNFAGTTLTTLYGIDSTTDSLMIQNPPNGGVLSIVGPLGVNVTAETGFDITEADHAAYAVINRSGSANSEIYRVNLTTGTAASVGAVNSPALIRGIAIPDPQPALQISKLGTNAVLTWSAASAGYVLEKSPSLSTPAWDTNLSSPVIVGNQKVVTNAWITTNRFFRLKK